MSIIVWTHINLKKKIIFLSLIKYRDIKPLWRMTAQSLAFLALRYVSDYLHDRLLYSW